MDALDRQILAALQSDGRQTNARLAESMGLSQSAMLERVRRLEQEGLIHGYRAVVDPVGFGLGLQAFIVVELKEHSRICIQNFERGIVTVPEVRACYHTTGRFDYLLHVAVHDLVHIGHVIKHDIAGIEGVSHLETMLVLSEVKADEGWPVRVSEGDDADSPTMKADVSATEPARTASSAQGQKRSRRASAE